jgi:hypothetical protein
MLDDPLSLLSLGIWLMAAGMWPVGMGFLFGACSACCDECGQCQCSHHLVAEALGFGNAGRFTLQNPVLSVTTPSGTIADFPADETLYGSDSGISIAGGNVVYTQWELRFAEAFILSVTDACGCHISAQETFIFRVDFFDENFEGDATATINATYVMGLDCDDDGGALQWDESAQSTSGQDFADFVDSLSLSGSYAFDPCECGACCDEGCRDDIPEGACENWAGVGTACDDDPDPCAEE